MKHEQEIKDRIGIVMDGSYFYNELSMQDMKSIVAPAYSKWSDADYRSYMEKFELDPKQKISTLSKGMRMKFALVLALSHQAELLIMDEPTSGLDPLVRSQFWGSSWTTWKTAARSFSRRISPLIWTRSRICSFS